jgi:hypothetical protein
MAVGRHFIAATNGPIESQPRASDHAECSKSVARGIVTFARYSHFLGNLPTVSKALTRTEPTATRVDFLVERDGFEPEISLAVLPRTQSGTSVTVTGSECR